MLTLQILHASDLEGGLDAIDNAPNFAAVVGALEEDAATAGYDSILLSAGDNYIPGPFFNAGGSSDLRGTYEGFYNELFGLIDTTALGFADDLNGDGFFDNGEIDTFLDANPGVAASTIYIQDVNGDGFPDFFDEIDDASGRLDIAIMNAMGFDASAVGNHEFDASASAFASAILYDSEEGNSLSSTSVSGLTDEFPGHLNFLQEVDNPGAQFPYLSGNLDFSGDGDLGELFTDQILPNDDFESDLTSARDDVNDPAFSGSDSRDDKIAQATTIEVDNGMGGTDRVGVIGATTQIIATITSSGDVTETSSNGTNDMAALAAVLQPQVDALIADGVNKIILVSHLQQLALEQELAGLLDGVDVIIAGGSDTRLADSQDRLRAGDVAEGDYPVQATDASGNPVLIVSTDGEYSYVGRLVVTFDDDGVVDLTSLDENVSGAFATDEQGVQDLLGAMVGKEGVALEETQEVPPVADGPATGDFDFFLDGTTLFVEGSVSDLSSDLNPVGAVDAEGNPQSAIHIHNAAAGVNGPIVRNLTVRDNGDGTADFQGEFTLTAGEITALEAGEFYINVHTVDNGGGELRGQFPAVADFDTLTGPVDSGAFEEVQNLTAQVTDIVTAQDAIIAGEAEVFLNGNRADVRTQETNFGNLTADANLAAAQAIDPTVLVSLKNGGGIRAAIGQQGDGVPEPTITEANPLSGKQAGEISALDIDNSLRFDNGLVTLDLTPEQLKIVLEHAVAATEDGATPGQFGQVGGLAFSFDPTQTAQVLGAGGVPTTEGERVQTITLIDANGNPTTEIFRDGAFNPDAPATIRVVTLDFLALFGGDGYPYGDFGVPITDLGIGEQQALVDFLSTNFSGGAAVIASDLTSGASVGLNSFTNDFAGAFSSAGDGFETYQRGVSGSFPFAVTDDSAGNFPTDDVGIVQTPDVDPFFGIVDTENDDNTGPVTATWAFDIAGETGLSVEIDFAAMGDFETSDIVSITASIDGGAAETLFDLVVDEDGSLTYTLESGTEVTLDDPMTIDGTVLNNVFQTFSADVTGTGNELTLTLTAVTNGGDEAVALRNIEVVAGGAAFDVEDTPVTQDTRIVNLAEQTDILDAPETTGDFTFNRVFQFNGGGAEVVAHEAGRLYVTNDGGGRIDVIDAATGTALVPIDVSTLDGFDGIQSVDVAGGIVAVAVKRAPAEQSFLGDTFDISQPGFVAFYDAAAGTLLSTVDVGNLPDDVTFSPDGSILMVAGEGEFNDDSDNDDDPLGVVSIVTVGDGTAPTVQTADFIKFAGLEEELREAGARIKASASAPFDFEPEYVAFAPDGATAYVTLQENNAVAVIDVATATVTDIIGLGTRDFATPGNGLDPLDDGNANIRTFDSDILVGWRMPDALEVFEVDGETFFVTANEGDSRDFDEERVEDLVDDGLLDEALEQRLRDQGLIDDDGDNDVGLERLEVSSVDGDTDGDGDIDVIHAFSTRGITIFDDDGAVVFDSGDLAEAFLAANFPDRFNDDDGDDGEDRSDAKGPEFEGVGVGEVDGELLLFALAERDSGVFVFNVNDPANPTFVNYIDGFSGSDQSPEVVEFISAADSTSGFAQIAVAYEVSGTVSLFDILPGGATIGSIQGAGATSAFEGQVVTAAGIVTAVDSDGFYLQDPVGDGDDATSDAIFVETGSAPTVAVGDEVEVTGTVEEDTPGGTSTRNLSTTQIADVTDVTVLSSGNALPEAIIIGTGGRIPPSESQPDAIAFFEAMESMRVTAQDVLATSPTNRFGEIFGVVDQGANATGVSSRNTLNIEPDDFNPEKVQIDEDSGIFNFDFPDVDAGALLGDVTGVLGYGFGNFEILVTEDFTGGITPSALAPETTSLTPADEDLTIATYNVLNLDPNETDGDTDVADGRFDAIAAQIVGALDAPDIIALQEIQDNSGETDDGTTAGDITLQTLVDSITAAGGPTYGFIDNTFITNNASGGAPGSNIRTAFLYDPTRVSVVEGSVQPVGDQEAGSPFDGARLPLSASFMFGEEEVTVVNNHFSSKSGSAAIMGTEQPFSDRQEEPDINGSLNERREQAQAVNDFVDGILAEDADAQVVVLGDLNEFEFVSPLDILKGEATSADDGFTLGAGDGTILENLIDELDPLEAYTFNFQGNSQVLDHVLVTSNLAAGAEIDILNVNTEFAETDMRASDHDPVLASLDFTPSVILSGDSGANTLVGGQDDDVLNGRGGADVLRGLAGDDRLIGGAGNDRMNGGADDDLLIGEGGNDRIVTGDGEDVIRIRNRDSGRDTITDFDVALDTIDLDGFGSLRLRDIDLGGRDGRVRLEVNDELVAILTGVDIDDLTRGNFDFG